MARHPRSRRRIPSLLLGLVPPPSSTPCRLSIAEFRLYLRQMPFGGKPTSALDHLTANCGVSGLSSHEALLLVGHGSARYPDAGVAMHRHAETLRAGGQ